MENIILDSFLGDLPEKPQTLEELKELTPLVRNYEVLFRFYGNNFSFSDEELVNLLWDLRYLNSKRYFYVLVIMKHRETDKYSKCVLEKNVNLLDEYNSIEAQYNLFYTSVYYDLRDLIFYLLNTFGDIFSDQLSKAFLLASSRGNIYLMTYFDNLGVKYSFEEGLLKSTQSGNIEAINFFKGCQINSTESIKLACKSGNLEIIKTLLEFKNNMTISGIISFCIESENIETINYFLNSNTKLNDKLIFDALESDNLEIFKTFYNCKKLTYNLNQLIKSAFSKNNLEIIEFLIDNNMKLKKELFKFAIKSKNPLIVKLLIDKGVNIDICSGLPLITATLCNNTEIIELLFNNGCNPTYLYSLDKNMPSWGVKSPTLSTIKFLIQCIKNFTENTQAKYITIQYLSDNLPPNL